MEAGPALQRAADDKGWMMVWWVEGAVALATGVQLDEARDKTVGVTEALFHLFQRGQTSPWLNWSGVAVVRLRMDGGRSKTFSAHL